MPHDKVLVITGASTGIGAATALAAAHDGFRLVLSARGADKLEQLAGQIDGGEDRVRVVTCDVAEWDQVAALRDAAIDAFGQVEAVFANAGFGAAPGWKDADPDEWKAMVLTNVYGAALTVKAFHGDLTDAKGHLVLTGSVAGRVHTKSLYGATKWAIGAMAEALRQDFQGTGVRTTVVEPGMVDTPFFDDGAPEWALHADDVARAVLYALTQPAHVDVNDILIRSVDQER